MFKQPRVVAFVLCSCALALAGCAKETPGGDEFSADTASVDTSAGEVAALDASARHDAPSASDTSAAPDTSAPDTSASKSCGQVLQCVLTAKSWQPGKPVPKDIACFNGVAAEATTELDTLLTCADGGCAQQVDAWDKGGDAELAALYACLIDQCPAPLAVCAGGQGKGDCGQALKCLGKCKPTDRACTLPCIADTTPPQASKTGAFLQCVLKACGGLANVPVCDIPLSCGLKCPEVAGG